MEHGLNFKSLENQEAYAACYDRSLKLLDIEVIEQFIETEYGSTHILISKNRTKPPLVLLHAASCTSCIWFQNLSCWSSSFCIYAVDLIGESSKSILKKKLKTPYDNACWIKQTLDGLKLTSIYLCGLSIGGWTAANFAAYYPDMVMKLILMSPVQTFAKMHTSYFFRIMKMGFHPTRENVEQYIGWGSAKEAPLPDSIIEQFTLSVMNMNSNASFPKWLNKGQLQKLNMPVYVLFGSQEFAFSIGKAVKRAERYVHNLKLEIIENASHLLCVSKPSDVNQRVVDFLLDEAD